MSKSPKFFDDIPPSRSARLGCLITRDERSGFTLVELLVVIGIIVLLIGLAVPAVLHSLKTGRRTRTVSDFQLIGTALEAYKADFGDYPRFDSDNTPNSINMMQDRGARLLCRALLSPGPAAVTGQGTVDFNGINNGGTGQAPDGADGPGFRVRPGGAGRVYQAYIQADKFPLGNPGAAAGASTGKWDSTNFTDATLLDPQGNPILYYPAAPGNITVSATTPPATPIFVCDATVNGVPQGNANPPLAQCLYNGFDNYGYGQSKITDQDLFMPATSVSANELAYLLGDIQQKGYIIPGSEQAVTTQPYLLWSAGEDGIFGFPGCHTVGATAASFAGQKTDDVTNFDLPSNMVKY